MSDSDAPEPSVDPLPALPFSAVGWALVAFVLSAVASLVVSVGVYFAFDRAELLSILVGQIALWTVLVGACKRYSRRHGTGDLRQDYGFAFERRDLWRGFGRFWMGAFYVTIIQSFITDPRFQGTNTGIERHFRGEALAFLLLSLVNVAGAPIVEELFFRGLLLRGLLARTVPRWAVFIQALVFGLAHVNPFIGLHNVSVFAFASTIGAVLGFAALRYRRLGPGMVAHGLQNTLAMTAVFLTR
ncbi:MAG: protease family protein [Actinomycetota bacterium]|jgi:membrane protease YdiL (CAAX protease family)